MWFAVFGVVRPSGHRRCKTMWSQMKILLYTPCGICGKQNKRLLHDSLLIHYDQCWQWISSANDKVIPAISWFIPVFECSCVWVEVTQCKIWHGCKQNFQIWWDFRFLRQQVWRWLPSGLLRCEVWYKLTSVSEVGNTSETSVTFYYTRYNMPKDCHLQKFKICFLMTNL